eukprot:1740448-Rhodomonas_salina.2
MALKEREREGISFATRLLCDVRYCPRARFTTRCPVVAYARVGLPFATVCCAMSGDVWYAHRGYLVCYAPATRCPRRKAWGLNSCRPVSAYALAAHIVHGRTRISLRACYTMSGTDVAYGRTCISLRACYAKSGTETACGGTSRQGTCVERRGGGGRSDPLSAYALATRCPVLRYRMVLSAYAMSGTKIPNGTVSLRACDAMSGTEKAYAYGAAESELRMLRKEIDTLEGSACCTALGRVYYYAMASSYALPMRCPAMLLHACYAMSGTEIGYAATRENGGRVGAETGSRGILLRRVRISSYAMPGTDIADGAGTETGNVILLRACYAMSGTEIGYVIVLHAMSGTGIGRLIVLRACYAMPGTEFGYAATR